MKETENAKILLDRIRTEKSRYCKDQFGVIINIAENLDDKTILEAVDYCVKMKLWSAGILKDALEYFSQKKLSIVDKIFPDTKDYIPSKYSNVKPQIRDISEYCKALKGDKDTWKN
ncbi:hypothetical protein [Clostridium oryzae]|uniref:Uncharacterized protein n=1 Tax=Clostridium oryzae TaxID=1450648 RepID=A0A1V4IUC6_9CLOT|nr:hypothetical protein [Clostridium oryzae]OPJ63385.1 hypothetical protein CLORY_11670 [Clostridium oryzae]